MAKAHSVYTPENSQPAPLHLRLGRHLLASSMRDGVGSMQGRRGGDGTVVNSVVKAVSSFLAIRALLRDNVCPNAYNVCMHTITWDPDKNQQLQRERDVSFDDVLLALMTDQVLADIPHPRPERYPGQRLLVVRIDDEAYVVPYVTSEEGFFLKTIFPSRKARRAYL